MPGFDIYSIAYVRAQRALNNLRRIKEAQKKTESWERMRRAWSAARATPSH